jgi:CheY-like chemotaxis protein
MDAQQLEALFRPYTQFHGARACEGSGLGMALSRRLARMMGGDLRVASTPGHGTTFTLSLPAVAPSLGDAPPVVEIAHDGASDAAASDAPGSDREGDLALPLAGFRILVAEDGPDNVRLYLRQLGRAGADVRVASNGREAVALAQAAAVGVLDAPFDLILMDVQMPVLDGLEATRRLRALGFTVPVVAVTAAAGEEERARCLAAGCDGFLEKPVRHAELVMAARSAALRGRVARSSGNPRGTGPILGHPREAVVRDPHPLP